MYYVCTMETITKKFNTIKQAEAYINKLYNNYNSVQLVNSPLFTESGIYTFIVQ